MPAVSVIIPSYNAARYLEEAVESVLAQTFTDLEVIVVDDGSTDETEAVMARYGPPVRTIKQRNGGVSSARNRGIAECRGRLVAFLDADDTWYPHKLQRQMEAMSARPGYRACFSTFMRVDAALNPLGISRDARGDIRLEDLLLRGNRVGSICTVLCERELFDQVGGFDPALSQCADWDMWVRIALHTDFLYIDEPLVTYRQHSTNMSRNARLLEQDSTRVLEKGFAMPSIPDALRPLRRRARARNDVMLAGCYYHASCYADTVRCLGRAFARDALSCYRVLTFPVRSAGRWLAAHRTAP